MAVRETVHLVQHQSQRTTSDIRVDRPWLQDPSTYTPYSDTVTGPSAVPASASSSSARRHNQPSTGSSFVDRDARGESSHASSSASGSTSVPLDSCERTLSGALVSSCYYLSDLNGAKGAYFAFPDLSIRVDGVFRLRLSLFNLSSLRTGNDEPAKAIHTCTTQPFESFPPRNAPGQQKNRASKRSTTIQHLLNPTDKKANEPRSEAMLPPRDLYSLTVTNRLVHPISLTTTVTLDGEQTTASRTVPPSGTYHVGRETRDKGTWTMTSSVRKVEIEVLGEVKVLEAPFDVVKGPTEHLVLVVEAQDGVLVVKWEE
ncbi:hypothetical protein HKX48_000802 [Thoreauomyces humboldtii]|nr:hypothetical protein HKX48_000802 [Thoreauomyces humboldtii]